MTQQHEPKPENKLRSRIDLIAVAAIVGFILFMEIYSQIDSRAGDARARLSGMCKNNLKQLGIGLDSYYETYGSFPPAYIADENGRPMHSWRVLLLPHIDQAPLYKEYSFDEPWDGPNNSKLHHRQIELYRCRAEEHEDKTMTSYVAVVGPKTAFPGINSVCLDDITDGAGNTILIVETENSGIHWMEPRDLHVTQMARTINPKSGQGISSAHPGGAHALFCDGGVRFRLDNIPPETLRRLLEINDGEPVGEY